MAGLLITIPKKREARRQVCSAKRHVETKFEGKRKQEEEDDDDKRDLEDDDDDDVVDDIDDDDEE